MYLRRKKKKKRGKNNGAKTEPEWWPTKPLFELLIPQQCHKKGTKKVKREESEKKEGKKKVKKEEMWNQKVGGERHF